MVPDLYSSESRRDKIRLYYKGELELSDCENEIRLRLESIFTYLIKNKCTDDEAVKFACKTHGISQRQAYYDVRDCKNLFGEVKEVSRTANRYIATQWAIEMYRMAQIKKDFRGMDRALKNFISANQLDKADPDLPDLSKIQPPIQVLSISLDFVSSPYFKMLAPEIQQQVVNLKKKAEDLFNGSPISDVMNMLMLEESNYQEISDESSESNPD